MPQLYVEQGRTKTEQTSAEPVTESAPAVESRETERIEVRGDVQVHVRCTFSACSTDRGPSPSPLDFPCVILGPVPLALPKHQFAPNKGGFGMMGLCAKQHG